MHTVFIVQFPNCELALRHPLLAILPPGSRVALPTPAALSSGGPLVVEIVQYVATDFLVGVTAKANKNPIDRDLLDLRAMGYEDISDCWSTWEVLERFTERIRAEARRDARQNAVFASAYGTGNQEVRGDEEDQPEVSDRCV